MRQSITGFFFKENSELPQYILNRAIYILFS